MESTDNGVPGAEKSKPLEQSVEDLSKGPPSSLPPQPKSRHLTIKYVGTITPRLLHPPSPTPGTRGWWEGQPGIEDHCKGLKQDLGDGCAKKPSRDGI